MMVVDDNGAIVTPHVKLDNPTHSVRLPFADDLRVIGGRAVMYRGDKWRDGGKLIRYEICVGRDCPAPLYPIPASSSDASEAPSLWPTDGPFSQAERVTPTVPWPATEASDATIVAPLEQMAPCGFTVKVKKHVGRRRTSGKYFYLETTRFPGFAQALPANGTTKAELFRAGKKRMEWRYQSVGHQGQHRACGGLLRV